MAGTEIRSITARQVYTNRGNPGVEAVVTTENGATGRAMCTSGISIGTHEIHFDFDGGDASAARAFWARCGTSTRSSPRR